MELMEHTRNIYICYNFHLNIHSKIKITINVIVMSVLLLHLTNNNKLQITHTNRQTDLPQGQNQKQIKYRSTPHTLNKETRASLAFVHFGK